MWIVVWDLRDGPLLLCRWHLAGLHRSEFRRECKPQDLGGILVYLWIEGTSPGCVAMKVGALVVFVIDFCAIRRSS